MENLRSKSYIINLKPISWARAGYNHKSGFYDAQAQEKLCYCIHIQHQHGDDPLFSKACSLDVIFFMPIPMNAKNKKNPPKYHTFTPDIDNLLKLLLDALRKNVVTDDKLFCMISAKKLYVHPSETRTEFTITEVE